MCGNRRSRPITGRAAGRAIEALEQRLLWAAHIVGNPAVYSTIQSAVNAAPAGATINVDPGNYAEQVAITKTLTLRGAQAGVDARLNTRRSGAGESIVTGANNSGVISCAFYINANDVTLDGFTVQGETSQSTSTGAGIVIAPGRFGAHILDNIVQNNVSGLFLANNSTSDPAVIQYNVFKNNNNNGSDGGRGIYTDGPISGGNLTNVTIDSNFFYGNHGGSGTTGLEGSIALESRAANSQSNIRITNNVMDYNGKGVLAYNATGILIQGNFVTESRDTGSGALRFEGGVTNVTVQANTLYDNPGNAIRIDMKAFNGVNNNFSITGNNIYGNGAGLLVIAGQYSGPLNAQNNWWGSASGPSGDSTGTGDAVEANGNNVVYSPWSTSPNGSRQAAYWGAPSVAGARIEAEDFDHGGEGIAYHDTEAKNTPGLDRPYQGVDIENTADNGGYDVTSVKAGEWLAYTVNVAQAGTYRFDFRVANGQQTGGTFHVESDGTNITGPITLPYTGGSQGWQTISKSGVSLAAGQHVLRLVFDANGSSGTIGNFNWYQFVNTASAAVPAAPGNLAVTAASTSQINLTWTNNATNQTGFKIDRSTDGVNFTTIATVTATSYSDTGLSAGTTYSYRVRATNASGDSSNSNVASATTLANTSSTTYLSDLQWVSATTGWGTVKKDLSVAGNPLTLNGTVYAKGIGTHAVSQIVYNLNGQYSSFLSDVGVDDEENGKGTGAVDFQVVGDGVVLFDSGVLSNRVAPAHVSANVTGVRQLTLLANNGVPGSIDYDHADWAGARLLGTPAAPVAPSGLAASAVSSSQINLTWTNNAANATAIKVYRSTGGVNFTAIATNLSPSTTTYSDTGLSAGTTYSYRVRATNSVGDSPDSNVASATTQSASAVVTYLSDLQWVSATAGWGTVQKDLSVAGNPLTLRGTVYAKGIGTHAVSQIVYNLAGQYSTFISDVGIDDEELTKGQGAVDFQVIGDGRLLFDSGVLTNSSPVVMINVSVAGVQQLTLVANNGVAGSIDYDHADWAGARLLSGGAAAAASPLTTTTNQSLNPLGPSAPWLASTVVA
jgi:fibronectin type 3 domain-containing protein